MEKGQGRGRGSAGEEKASFGSPGGLPVRPLPDGGLITVRPPVHPDCTWGLRRRCGDLCTGPFPGTDDGFHLALPAHSPPSLGPARGSWAPQARPAPFSGLHLAPAAIRAQTAGKASPSLSCRLELAFTFSLLQLRGRHQCLSHPQDGLGAWVHRHQSSRCCHSHATPWIVCKLGSDVPISPLTDDSSLYWRFCVT